MTNNYNYSLVNFNLEPKEVNIHGDIWFSLVLVIALILLGSYLKETVELLIA